MIFDVHVQTCNNNLVHANAMAEPAKHTHTQTVTSLVHVDFWYIPVCVVLRMSVIYTCDTAGMHIEYTSVRSAMYALYTCDTAGMRIE